MYSYFWGTSFTDGLLLRILDAKILQENPTAPSNVLIIHLKKNETRVIDVFCYLSRRLSPYVTIKGI